jgi:hypothetical protein
MVSADTVYSQEGTAAHAVKQRCLSLGLEPHDFIGEIIEKVAVTAEMAEAVAIDVNYCRWLMGFADQFWIEEQVSLAKLNPPADMFGTLDFGAYFAERQELHIVDFKYGKGVWVTAKDNVQLRYYALAAALTFNLPVSTVVTTVIQPRFGGSSDPIRSAVVDAVTMAEFAIALITKAHVAMQAHAPIAAGDWCKFCPVKNSCLVHQTYQTPRPIGNSHFHHRPNSQQRSQIVTCRPSKLKTSKG